MGAKNEISCPVSETGLPEVSVLKYESTGFEEISLKLSESGFKIKKD
jgi:hypothetical protein